MASTVPVVGLDFEFGVCLYSQADTKLLITAPTLAAGDFQQSTNNGAWTNLVNLPAVDPAAGAQVTVVVDATELTTAGAGGYITVKWEDQVGAQWCSGYCTLRVWSADLDGSIAAILLDTGTTLDGRIPAALVGGRMDASVGAIAAGAITAAAIATDAIDADSLKADAVTEIQSGLSTLTAQNVADALKLAPTAGAPADGSVNADLDTLRAGVTLADDAITSAKYDESSAYPLKSADTGSTAVARTGADSDTLETLSDQVDTVTTNVSTLLSRVTSTLFSGITSLAAWLRGLARTSTMDTTAKAELNASAGSYDESTDSLQALGDAMDQCTVTVVSGVDGDTITVVPYTTWEFTVSGMATLAGAAENGVVFTVKNRATDSDDNAILQVQETVGLVRLNGAAGTAGKATLTVAESETALTVHVNASQTGSVAPGSLHWDVKMVVTTAEDADQMASGVFEVSDPAVTRMLTL